MKQKILIFISAACLSLGYLMWSDYKPQPVVVPDSISKNKPTEQSMVSKTQVGTVEDEVSSEDRFNPAPLAGTTSEKIPDTAERNGKKYPVRVYKPLDLPNDPLLQQSWVGQAKIDQVWSKPRSQNETTLAIIDSGFALDHEEFNGRWAKNSNETGAALNEAPSVYNCTDRGLPLDASCNLIDENRDGIVDNEAGGVSYENPSRLNCSAQGREPTKDCNLIDDDGNGYVDDHTGWDFMNFDNSVQAGELNPNGSGTTHGTMVAGLAAGTGNNGLGISGVDWSTKILPIQALDDDSYGDTYSVGDAIYYAVEQKADVISLSLGSELPDDYVLEAVQAAVKAGIVVVAASGNDGCDCMVYPANYSEVLAVGALDETGSAANFSSWGSALDIMAPGVNLTSTTWSSGNPSSAYVSGIDGTSFATPIVSGVITTLLSRQPTATPLQLTAALTESVNRTMHSQTVTRSNSWGFGSLDAAKADARMTTPHAPGMLYRYTPIHHGSYLNPLAPLETTPSQVIHKCSGNVVGATPIYNVTKNGKDFFTASRAENRKAITQGYVSKLFAYGCVQQPHDTAETVRRLNIFREFKNDSSKDAGV